MTDRMTKCLLALAALGLSACALMTWQAPARAGGMPPPVIYTPASPPLLSVSASGIAYVVSGGYISAYSVEGSPRRLKEIGRERIPDAPAPVPPVLHAY